MWVTAIASLGTMSLTIAEPQTNSNLSEWPPRTLGLRGAGRLLAFAAMRSAAPFVVGLVSIGMIAAAVLGLSRRSTIGARRGRSWRPGLAHLARTDCAGFGTVRGGRCFMTRIVLGVIAVAIGVGAAAAIAGAAVWNRATAAAINRIETSAPAAAIDATGAAADSSWSRRSRPLAPTSSIRLIAAAVARFHTAAPAIAAAAPAPIATAITPRTMRVMRRRPSANSAETSAIIPSEDEPDPGCSRRWPSSCSDSRAPVAGRAPRRRSSRSTRARLQMARRRAWRRRRGRRRVQRRSPACAAARCRLLRVWGSASAIVPSDAIADTHITQPPSIVIVPAAKPGTPDAA